MWTPKDIKEFYGRYAARYDQEIEADPDSYPAPDKVAGWLISHLELVGILPSSKPVPDATNEVDDATPVSYLGTSNDLVTRVTDECTEESNNTDADSAICLNSRTSVDVLDLGCGTGKSSRLFFEYPQDETILKLTGVDATPEMLEIARSYPFHALHCQDIEQPLDFPDNSYDVVVCVGVMDFIVLAKPFLQQVARVLRPDGIFGVTFPERRQPAEAGGDQPKMMDGTVLREETDCEELSAYDSREACNLLTSCGFKVHRKERFLGYVDSENGRPTHYYGYLLGIEECS